MKNPENYDVKSYGNILIVDDTVTRQMKLAKAVQNLGHQPHTADSGETALSMLEHNHYDLILLDLIMPGIDGFEVLEKLKSNPETDWVPVIIISSYDEMENVVRAIKAGAEDFLPIGFNASVLNARIKICLSNKWQRERELEFLKRTALLTDAAKTVRQGTYNPSRLGLGPLLQKNDDLGTLGKVFSDMAGTIYIRETKLKAQAHTLKCVLLLLLTGVVLGSGAPLSRMTAELHANPFGIALHVSLVAAALGITYSVMRGRLPRMGKSVLIFLLIWGMLSASAAVIMFWVAENVAASSLSIILVCEGFIVFAIAALLRIETPTIKRLSGLGLGFTGVVVLIWSGVGAESSNSWIWLMIALLIPLNYAGEDLLLAARMPADADLIGMVGLVSLVAAVLLLPLTYWFNDFVPLSFDLGFYELLIGLFGLRVVIGMTLFSALLLSAGAVFGSQVGYVKAFAGIVWSILLLHESLPLIAWLSFAVILLGLFMVESRQQENAEWAEST